LRSSEMSEIIAEALAEKMLLQMFGNDTALIEGWKEKSDTKWLVALGFVSKEVVPLREALKPFADERMPSARRTEVAFDRGGLRRCISPLELARDRAFRALNPR